MKNPLIYLLLLIILSGCGPVYETKSSYTRPNSPEGVACTFQCENSRLSCSHNQDLKLQNCEANNRFAKFEYQQCISKNGKDKCDEVFHLCDVDNNSCKATYNKCYESCGGDVITRTVCVEDCDE